MSSNYLLRMTHANNEITIWSILRHKIELWNFQKSKPSLHELQMTTLKTTTPQTFLPPLKNTAPQKGAAIWRIYIYVFWRWIFGVLRIYIYVECKIASASGVAIFMRNIDSSNVFAMVQKRYRGAYSDLQWPPLKHLWFFILRIYIYIYILEECGSAWNARRLAQ